MSFFSHRRQYIGYRPKLTLSSSRARLKNFLQISLLAVPGGALTSYPSKLSPYFSVLAPGYTCPLATSVCHCVVVQVSFP